MAGELNLIVKKITVFAVVWTKTILRKHFISFPDGLANIRKTTLIFIFAKKPYLNHPFFSPFVPIDSSNPTLIINPFTAILPIHYVGNVAQILYAIIKAVPVDVVNIVRGHLPVMNKPDKPMDKKAVPINTNLIISSLAAVNIPRLRSGPSPCSRIDLPFQFASFRVVIESLFCSFCCKCSSFHVVEYTT